MMDDYYSDRPDENNDPASYLIRLEKTNRLLNQQVTTCNEELRVMQTTLLEAQRVLTESRQLEAERSNLLMRERELNELKSNFVTLASHEFRTPMMTILSSVSLIGRYNSEADAEKRERHVQRIKLAVSSLTNMLNDFLSISQMEQNRVILHPIPLDIRQLCAEIIADAKAVAKPHQRFNYQHLGGYSVLTADRQILNNILLNLLTNASKYSAEDTDIYLTSLVQNNWLTFTVTDQGIGIPDVDKDKLFINFFRARNAIHIQGTGLGLYLVKRYVDLLGGTIHFTSQVSEGTIFTVQLPFVDKSV